MAALAEAFMRLRADPSQLKADAEKGLGQASGTAAGRKVGQQFGEGVYRDAQGRLRDMHNKFVKDSASAGTSAGRQAGTNYSNAFSGGLSRLKSLAQTVAPIMGAVFGGAVLTSGIKYVANLEQANIGFQTMLGSARAATDMVRQLQDFAAKTPFNFPDLVTASQRLIAFGFSAKQVIPMLTAIGDAAAGLGLGAEGVNRITYAIGQMQAKTRVQSDELLQLTEAGIPALRILANAYGVTTAQMQEMVTKGVVSSAKAIPLLLAGIEKGTKGAAGATTAFGGLMKAQATTLTGLWSNFVDVANQKLGQFLAPAMPTIKAGLAWLVNNIGGLFNVVAAGVGGFAAFIKWLRDAGGMAVAAAAALSGLTAAVIAYTIVTRAVALATKAWIAVQTLLNIVMAANPVVLIIAAIAALAAAVYVAWTRSAAFRDVVIGVWNALKSAAATVWGAISKAIGAAGDVIRDVAGVFAATGRAITGAWQAVVSFFSSSGTGPVAAAFGVIRSIAASFTEWWRANGEALKQIWSAIWGTLQAVFAPIWAIVVAVVQAGWNLITAIFQTAWGIVSAIWQAGWSALSGVASAAWTIITSVISAAWSTIQTIFTVATGIISAAWSAVWATMQAVLSVAWAAIQAIFKVAWDIIVGIFTTAINLLTGRWGAAWAAIQATGIQVWNAITTFFTTALATFSAWWSTVWNAIVTTVRTIWTGLTTFFSSWWSALSASFTAAVAGIASALSAAWDGIKATATAVWEGIKSAIGAVWEGIKDVIVAPIKWVADHVWNTFANVVNTFTGFLGMGKPIPTLNLAAGGPVPQMFAGRGDRQPAMLEAGETVVSRAHSRLPFMQAAFTAAGVPGYQGGGIIGSIWSGITDIAGWVGGHVWDALKDLGELARHLVLGSLVSVARPLVDAVLGQLSGIPGAGSGWAGAVAAMPKKAADAFLAWLAGADKAAAAKTGAGQVPPATGLTGPVQDIARMLLAQMGWADQWNSFYQLVMHESGWDVHATNPESGAYGIPQALPPGKMASAGADWRDNAETQLRWMMGYIRDTYGSPDAAWAAWQSRSPHWYRRGGRVRRYAIGGRIPEPVLGLGRSGQAYGFDAGEQVVTARSMAGTADRLDRIAGLLARLVDVTAAVPAATGAHVGGALGGSAADASFRIRYPRGGW